jgi:hypothetical protein
MDSGAEQERWYDYVRVATVEIRTIQDKANPEIAGPGLQRTVCFPSTG